MLFRSAYEALAADPEAGYAYTMLLNLTLVITTGGIFFATLIWDFVIPLCFGNGQTLGKKIFGIGLMRQDGVRVTGKEMFARAILGKYTIETMVPVLIILMIVSGSIGIVGPIVIGLILLLNVITMIATRTNSPIHDLLASTVTVDIGSQMIFDSRADLIAYKEKVHAEKVRNSTY